MGWVHGGAGATGRTTGESACPSQHCTDHPRGVPSGGGRDGPWADSGGGWGVGHVGLAVAGAAPGAVPLRHGVSDQVSPPVDGGHPDPAPRGGGALGVWGGACRATWRKASKRKSLTPSPRVAAWTRVAARMGVLVPEVRRYSTTSCSPSPRRCCRTAAGLCRA